MTITDLGYRVLIGHYLEGKFELKLCNHSPPPLYSELWFGLVTLVDVRWNNAKGELQ
jgi:hypothetical protein